MAKSKKEIVGILSDRTGVSRVAVSDLYFNLMQILSEDLRNGERVVLTGVGSFVPRTRAARTARNPSNGKPVHVPEKKVVKFTASSKLLDVLNRD